jgi:uncharacterized protein (TIGR03905 family)
MTKHIEYATSGTCSKAIIIDVENDIITNCKFVGGCHGNTQGVSALVKGRRVDEVIETLKGIKCGMRSTSCPDQLSRALEELSEQ